ncbi:MAG: hypothetical protein LBI69_01020 [Puniceicoccales bacterium]|jgi:hypothetical protein|nr:hypothetical protein [Puniceicoccales bacterium]
MLTFRNSSKNSLTPAEQNNHVPSFNSAQTPTVHPFNVPFPALWKPEDVSIIKQNFASLTWPQTNSWNATDVPDVPMTIMPMQFENDRSRQINSLLPNKRQRRASEPPPPKAAISAAYALIVEKKFDIKFSVETLIAVSVTSAIVANVLIQICIQKSPQIAAQIFAKIAEQTLDKSAQILEDLIGINCLFAATIFSQAGIYGTWIGLANVFFKISQDKARTFLTTLEHKTSAKILLATPPANRATILAWLMTQVPQVGQMVAVAILEEMVTQLPCGAAEAVWKMKLKSSIPAVSLLLMIPPSSTALILCTMCDSDWKESQMNDSVRMNFGGAMAILLEMNSQVAARILQAMIWEWDDDGTAQKGRTKVTTILMGMVRHLQREKAANIIAMMDAVSRIFLIDQMCTLESALPVAGILENMRLIDSASIFITMAFHFPECLAKLIESLPFNHTAKILLKICDLKYQEVAMQILLPLNFEKMDAILQKQRLSEFIRKGIKPCKESEQKSSFIDTTAAPK